MFFKFRYTTTQPVLSLERWKNNEGGLNLILLLCWKVQACVVLLSHANLSLFCTPHVTGLSQGKTFLSINGICSLLPEHSERPVGKVETFWTAAQGLCVQRILWKYRVKKFPFSTITGSSQSHELYWHTDTLLVSADPWTTEIPGILQECAKGRASQMPARRRVSSKPVEKSFTSMVLHLAQHGTLSTGSHPRPL